MRIEYADRCLYVKVTHFTPYTPAKIHALPEDCYPEEGPELEFEFTDENPDPEFLTEMMEYNPYFLAGVEECIYEALDS